MISKKLEQAINKQINAEIYSSYLYESMAAYYESINLKGFAHWMYVQALEEKTHAKRFFNYVCDRGGRVTLTSIAAPPVKWDSPTEPFGDAYKHEQKVTGLINNIANISIEEKDHLTTNMLQWFINEQVEEEASALDVYQKLKLLKGRGDGLFILDKDLAVRAIGPVAQVVLLTGSVPPA